MDGQTHQGVIFCGKAPLSKTYDPEYREKMSISFRSIGSFESNAK